MDGLTMELYAQLRKLAVCRMSRNAGSVTLQPTVLAHEAWLKLSEKDVSWANNRHFLAAAATTMQNILIDHARKRARLRHGGSLVRTRVEHLNSVPTPSPDESLLLMDEGIRELEKQFPVRAKVVVWRFFGGLTDREIAEELGLCERSVERHWAAAKVWLYNWMSATKGL
jgi:RNA polymerase sigma factor (TIGR02999 family)